MSMISSKFNAARKISRNIEDDVLVIENYIQAINSVGEFEVLLNGYPFDEIQIPNEFKEFVAPRSVRMIAGDLRFEDLLSRPTAPKKVPSYAEFKNAVMAVRSAYKADPNDNMTPLNEIRKDMCLADVIKISNIQTRGCFDEGLSYFPIQLSERVSALIGASSPLVNPDVMIENYLNQKRF